MGGTFPLPLTLPSGRFRFPTGGMRFSGRVLLIGLSLPAFEFLTVALGIAPVVAIGELCTFRLAFFGETASAFCSGLSGVVNTASEDFPTLIKFAVGLLAWGIS